MKLSWQVPVSETGHRIYPRGYRYATTDDENYDADGADPQAAVTALAAVLELALARKEHRE